MNLEKLKVRNPNMDILRIIAVLCVIGIHFFYHSGYYYTTNDNVFCNCSAHIVFCLRTAVYDTVGISFVQQNAEKGLLFGHKKNHNSLHSCGDCLYDL